MLLLGLTVAMSVQIVGALLVLSVICTPAAAAMRERRCGVMAHLYCGVLRSTLSRDGVPAVTVAA